MANAILAIAPDTLSARKFGYVSAIGTTRRVRGLYRAGYTMKFMAERTGRTVKSIWSVAAGHTKSVEVAFAERIRELADALPPVGPSKRSRAIGVRNNWLPLAVWDDETIDDPSARPKGLTLVSKCHAKAGLTDRQSRIVRLMDMYDVPPECSYRDVRSYLRARGCETRVGQEDDLRAAVKYRRLRRVTMVG